MIKLSKIIDYILGNFNHILSVMLWSVFFVFLIFPILIDLKFVRAFLSSSTQDPLIALTAFILLLIINFWARIQSLWQRYKNTYKLEKPPFIYLNYIVLFIIFSCILITLFQSKFIPNCSLEFIFFAKLNFIFIIGWFLSSCFRKKEKKEQEIENTDIYSLSDEPIQFAEQDLLGREEFIEGLYKEIINLPFSESFVLGLQGSWGEGKTSVINLLISKFKENEDFLIVNFDPWYFKDEEAILAAFYKQIEQTISQKFIFSDLKKTFTRYQKLISSGLSQTGINIDLPHIEESLEENRQRIESYITQTGKKIIILIDDIDRLQTEEILLIFKLVRINAKFKNTIFILSFDENYVNDILEEKWATSGIWNNQNLNLIHKRPSHAV